MIRSTENRDNRSAKARILEVYEMDGNWKALAENLSIPKTTLYRWISKGNRFIAGIQSKIPAAVALLCSY